MIRTQLSSGRDNHRRGHGAILAFLHFSPPIYGGAAETTIKHEQSQYPFSKAFNNALGFGSVRSAHGDLLDQIATKLEQTESTIKGLHSKRDR
jgi:hypothetical protein